MLVFEMRGETGVPGEKHLGAKETEPTTKSTHIWRGRRNLNLVHIGARLVLILNAHNTRNVEYLLL